MARPPADPSGRSWAPDPPCQDLGQGFRGGRQPLFWEVPGGCGSGYVGGRHWAGFMLRVHLGVVYAEV